MKLHEPCWRTLCRGLSRAEASTGPALADLSYPHLYIRVTLRSTFMPSLARRKIGVDQTAFWHSDLSVWGFPYTGESALPGLRALELC